MKKIVLLSIAATFCGAAAQTPRHLDPAVVAVGKELPRSHFASYEGAREALLDDHRSKYLQPLTEWTPTETPEATRFRTRFKVPFGWIGRRQLLRLERVSGSFDVVVNGAQIAYSQTGSAPAEFDLTDSSCEGNNDLEIVVYRDPAAAHALENGRPNPTPAITGEAWILSQPRMRVRDVVIETRMEGTSGLLELGVVVKNHQLNAHDCTVNYELLSPWGETLAEGHKDVTLDLRREDTVHFFANIPLITPWSHEEPRLYTLLIKTRNEGRFREYLSLPVGFRRFDVKDGIIRLNGVPLALKALDFTPTDDLAAMRTQISTLQAQGINTLILRGLPPRNSFYDLCDELGVYVAPRADIDTHAAGDGRRRGENPSNGPEWQGAFLDRTTAMWHGAKNHPCVIFFSLANRSANGCNLYDSYLAIKALEHHRAVVYPEGGEWNNDRLDFGGMEAAAALEKSSTRGKPIELRASDDSSGRFELVNHHRHTPFDGAADYTVTIGHKVAGRGSVPLVVPPGESVSFTVPMSATQKRGKPVSVKVEVVTRGPSGRFLPREASGGVKKIFRDPSAPIPETEKIVVASTINLGTL